MNSEEAGIVLEYEYWERDGSATFGPEKRYHLKTMNIFGNILTFSRQHQRSDTISMQSKVYGMWLPSWEHKFELQTDRNRVVSVIGEMSSPQNTSWRHYKWHCYITQRSYARLRSDKDMEWHRVIDRMDAKLVCVDQHSSTSAKLHQIRPFGIIKLVRCPGPRNLIAAFQVLNTIWHRDILAAKLILHEGIPVWNHFHLERIISFLIGLRVVISAFMFIRFF